MVFAAFEPPWMCANNSTACLESNSSSAQNKVYSTATRPIELYDRRCLLNRSDWKFADYDLYEGPHQTIVNEVYMYNSFLYNLLLGAVGMQHSLQIYLHFDLKSVFFFSI